MRKDIPPTADSEPILFSLGNPIVSSGNLILSSADVNSIDAEESIIGMQPSITPVPSAALFVT